MKTYNVLILGGGGREHALAWAVSQSPLLGKLFIAPGNPGTAQLGTNVELNPSDSAQVLAAVRAHAIDLVIVGPEQPLVDGIADALEAEGVACFGPKKQAAMLEGSKSYAKAIMTKYGVPTAAYAEFTLDQHEEIKSYLYNKASIPVVLKADGLAAGKGVFICESREQALNYLKEIKNDSTLSAAASKIVFEEFMMGEEVSVFAVTDGNMAIQLIPAQDHKRIGDGDTGLNTGGMGAYSPAPVLTEALKEVVQRTIIEPMINGMKAEGCPYVGVLYCGLMMTKQGPKVVEFNCRFGDPECQVVMPHLESDALSLFLHTVKGTLHEADIRFKGGFYTGIILASKGYPQAYQKGFPITGLDQLGEDMHVFHSGTTLKNGTLCTNGGRVLAVVAHGETLSASIQQAYLASAKIEFANKYQRSDIGRKGLLHFDA